MEQITLDMTPGGVTPNAHASQYDNIRYIRFNLKDLGATYTLTGAETITIKVTKPDGTTATVPITNTSSTYIIFPVDGTLDDVSGICTCELKIMNGADVLYSQNFNLRVEVDPQDGKAIIKTVKGAIAEFNTDLAGALVDCKLDIGYSADGYTSATVINSKTTPVIDQTPYQLRQAPTAIGNLALEKIVGLTVCFNQLVNTGDTSVNTVSGHKYYTSINGTKSIIQGGSAVSINDSSEDNIIDLTAMFGPEVADYLYNLENG